MRLLIGYDGSPAVEQALADLRRAGLPTSGSALVVSIADVLPAAPDPGGAPHSPARTRAVQVAEAALAAARVQSERGAELARKVLPDWNVVAEAAADSPFWGLVKRAESWPAELILVGVHGRSAVSRWVLGSVSSTVAANARCSVRIGRASRRKMDEPAQLLVGIDGSRGAADAVQALAERRWPAGSKVQVLAVIDSAVHTALAASVDPFVHHWSRPYDQDAEAWVTRALESSCAELAEAGVACETSVVHGDPKRLIVEHAEQIDADCIFVGAQGLSRTERFLLGSVSGAVAARAHCSVEIVRRPD